MNAPPSVRSATSTVAVRSVHEACVFVDELDRPSTGELLVSAVGGQTDQTGVVFVEHGRVCWAAARGLARRLADLLCAATGTARPRMEAIYSLCKERRRPLGEYLVEEGFVSAAALRVALLQHTVESCERICVPGATGTWVGRPAGGYSPSFTFDTAEIVVALGSSRHAARSREVRPVLDLLFREDEWAAAFVRGGSAAPEPIALRGKAPGGSSNLARVGKWAVSALDLVALTQPRDAVFAAKTAHGALVAFRGPGDVIVAAETDAHGPARVLNRRSAERRNQAG